MAKTKAPDPKVDALRQHASLNPYPQRVSDPLFVSGDFFDSRDLIQVKYEMVRRVRAEGQSIAQSAKAFGLSRPSFYQAQAALEREGLSGLLAKKRGPRRSHKLGAQVMGFVQALLSQEPSLSSSALAARVRQRFKLQVHSRSIERALVRQEKKRR
jgi:transposase